MASRGRYMVLGFRAANLVAGFEGYRKYPYWDPWGKVWTIGYGETNGIGPHTRPWSKTYARARLIIRLNQFGRQIWPLLKRRPNWFQWGAMVSLAYNIGPGNFARSSTLRYFNENNMGRAADRFLVWNEAGGVVLEGLKNRRSSERRYFLRHK